MQRKFITNLALLLFLNLLIKPFWIFGIDREVQNTVSPEEYGVYFALFNFSMLFNILLDFGINIYNTRNIAQHRQLLAKYFSGIVLFKFLLAIIYFLVTFVVGYLVGYDSSRFYMLLFLAINQFLISFIQYLRSSIMGLLLFTLDNVLSVLDKTLMIGFCAVLLWGNVFDVEFQLIHFIYAQTLAYSITLVIVFGIVLSKAKQFKFKLNKSFSLLILKQTYPFALLVVAMMFYYRLDAIMLDLLLEDGEHQAAIYAQSYRLMDAFIQIPIMFAGLLLPLFAYRIKQRKGVNDLLKVSFEFIFVIAVPVALIISFYAEEIIRLLYHSDIASASRVLQVLIFGFISIALTNIFGTILTANGNLKKLNIMAIGGVFLNLILNLILIPELGAYGAAFASVLTHFIVVVVQILVVVKEFKLRYNFKYLMSLLFFVVLLLSAVVRLKDLIQEPIPRVLAVLAIALGLSVVLKIIDLKKLYYVVMKEDAE